MKKLLILAIFYAPSALISSATFIPHPVLSQRKATPPTESREESAKKFLRVFNTMFNTSTDDSPLRYLQNSLNYLNGNRSQASFPSDGYGLVCLFHRRSNKIFIEALECRERQWIADKRSLLATQPTSKNTQMKLEALALLENTLNRRIELTEAVTAQIEEEQQKQQTTTNAAEEAKWVMVDKGTTRREHEELGASDFNWMNKFSLRELVVGNCDIL
jgi:hypothetical protein